MRGGGGHNILHNEQQAVRTCNGLLVTWCQVRAAFLSCVAPVLLYDEAEVEAGEPS